MEARLCAALSASASCTLHTQAPDGGLDAQALWVLYVFEGCVVSMPHSLSIRRGERVALESATLLQPDVSARYCLLRCEAPVPSMNLLRGCIGRRQLSPGELGCAEALTKLYFSQDGNAECQRHLALALLTACDRQDEGEAPPPRLQRLMEWMETHCTQELTLEEICRKSQYNRAYLGRLFQRWVGVAPLEYLRRLRVRKAQQLLSQTDLPIKEVSSVSGYADPQSFFRHFKQVTGMTPSAYRGAEMAQQRRNPACEP